MKRKPVSGISLILLLVSMLALASNIQPFKAAGGTFYIRGEGLVDPPIARVLTDRSRLTEEEDSTERITLKAYKFESLSTVTESLLSSGSTTWPVPGYKNIGHAYGDWSFSPYYNTALFHSGVDIFAPIDTGVFSVMGGEVTIADSETLRIDVGGGIYHWYGHLRNLQVVDGQVIGENKWVANITDFVGYPSDAMDHLHFDVGSDTHEYVKYNPLNILPFTDTTRPLIIYGEEAGPSAANPFELKYDDGAGVGSGKVDKTGDKEGYWIIEGKIDILVQVRDNNGAKDSNGNAVSCGTYKVGYALQRYDTATWIYGTRTDPKWLVEFKDGFPWKLYSSDMAAVVKTVYGDASNIATNDYVYIVTNNKLGDGSYANLDKKARWDTKINKAETDTATDNFDAKYPDGKYLIHGQARDYRDTYADAAGMDMTARVDNFLPSEKQHQPSSGSTNVPTDTNIIVIFSEKMDQSSVEDAFTITGGGQTLTKADGAFTWTEDTLDGVKVDKMEFKPITDLDAQTQYEVKITTSATDLGKKSLATDCSWTFTTSGLPEFPFGAAMEIALAIVIISILWKAKAKSKSKAIGTSFSSR